MLWAQTLEFYTSYRYYNPAGVKHGFLAFTPTIKLNWSPYLSQKTIQRNNELSFAVEIATLHKHFLKSCIICEIITLLKPLTSHLPLTKQHNS